MEITAAQRRALYMQEFRRAVDNKDIEGAKTAFLERVLPANRNDWEKAISNVSQSYTGCSFQTPVTTQAMLSMLETAHPEVVAAIESAAKSCDIKLTP